MSDEDKSFRCGDLVKRSEHWHRTRSGNYRDQLGIVVGVEFYNEDGSEYGTIAWPIVHWEGAVMESLTHPDNVDLYRK